MSESTELVKAAFDQFAHPQHALSVPNDGPKLVVPYVAHRGKKSEKNTAALNAAGITVDPSGSGMFYLMDAGEPIKTEYQQTHREIPLHLVQYARLYTLTDDDNQILDAMEKAPNKAQWNEGFREHIFAAVLVVIAPGVYKPATLQLQSGLTKGLKFLDAQLSAASDQKGWAARSPAHAASAVLPWPGVRFRFYLGSKLTRPDDGGQPYNEGTGMTVPTPKDEVPQLQAYLDTRPVDLLAAAKKFEWILTQAREKIGASGGP